MIGFYIFFAFVVALIADFLSDNLDIKPQSISHLLLQPRLVYLTGLLFGLIYLIDLLKGEYFWLAFVIVFIILMGLDIVLHKRIIKKVIHIIGYFIIMGIILYVMLYTRYQLQTQFSQPCWSPNGKQIAFFMEKALYRYHPSMFSFSSPDDIWKKYYICTMDYDGGNFKQIKQMNSSGYIRWSGSGNIVFTQGSEINNKPEARMYKIQPDGNGLEELWRWDDQTEYQGALWLSPQEDYFMLYKSTGTTQVYAIYDRKKKQIKKELPFLNVNIHYHGSYNTNEIALFLEEIALKPKIRSLVKYNIDTDKIQQQDILDNSYYARPKYLDGFEYTIASRSYSPDRSMYAREGGVWTVDNNKVVSDFYVKPKHSYLFNIFPK